MHYKSFKRKKGIIALLTLISTPLVFAQELKEEVLSQTKQEILNYSYEKSLQDAQKLKKDWINPFSYKYIYNDGEDYTTKRSTIAISQPIFKSGGIYYAIKYANSTGRYSKASIDVQKNELIKQTVELLFEIKKIDISIEKQKLLVKNGKLDVTRKKEQVLNGLLDTSFLDNAILDTNTKQNALIDLEHQKEMLINNLKTLSDKKYSEVELPVLTLIDDESFLQNNIYVKQAKEDITNSYWMKNMVVSNYLPSVNFTADYSKYHDRGGNLQLPDESTTNVGFNITIPIDIRFNNSIQSSKIEYLQKKATLDDQKRQEMALFENALSKIKSLDAKITIAKEDVELYDSLLTQLQEQLSVGMKTISDVETMENSKEIKKLEVQSLNIDKQIELLEIYSRVHNG
jgi:outer membrane protein TolC